MRRDQPAHPANAQQPVLEAPAPSSPANGTMEAGSQGMSSNVFQCQGKSEECPRMPNSFCRAPHIADTLHSFSASTAPPPHILGTHCRYRRREERHAVCLRARGIMCLRARRETSRCRAVLWLWRVEQVSVVCARAACVSCNSITTPLHAPLPSSTKRLSHASQRKGCKFDMGVREKWRMNAMVKQWTPAAHSVCEAVRESPSGEKGSCTISACVRKRCMCAE